MTSAVLAFARRGFRVLDAVETPSLNGDDDDDDDDDDDGGRKEVL
jgi:hypothetical protein